MTERDRPMESKVRIFKVCKLAVDLTDEDFRHFDKMIQQQLQETAFLFKGTDEHKSQKLGEANTTILVKLRELRAAVQVLLGLPK